MTYSEWLRHISAERRRTQIKIALLTIRDSMSEHRWLRKNTKWDNKPAKA